MPAIVPVFELPLSAGHVRMLSDGVFFLAHLEALARDARIEPRCTRCGQVATATRNVAADEVFVSCGCRSWRVKTDRPLDVAPLLLSLGWDLCCADCRAGAVGENDPQGTVFRVTCPCQTRAYRVPVH